MPNDYEVGALRVKNLGDQPAGIPETLKLMYEGKHYIFEPGQEALVPKAAAILWFGDNNHPDDPNRLWNRQDEIKRLRTRYGLMDAPYVGNLGLKDWSEGFPNVEVKDYEGTPVTMLIHDLEGKTVKVATSTEAQVEAYEDRISLLERELQSLKATKEMALPPQNATAADVPEDSPERRRGRAS